MGQSAIGYVRVSTERQATEGVSLDAQRAKIEAWCIVNGYTLVGIFVDAGLSGGRADNRPELQKALAAVGACRGALVVYSLSRLARSTQDTLTISEQLEKVGADLVSLSEKIDTTTAAGKMVFRMLAVLAEFERDQISERTTAALQHKRSRGERVGRIPFGYSLSVGGVQLVPEAGELRTVEMIRAMRSEGDSYRSIARKLSERGIVAKSGGAWHAKVLRDICSRKVDPVGA